MYKTVYREKYGKLTIRERSYTFSLDEANYRESDDIPVPVERIRPAQAGQLSTFVRHYVADHPKTDLLDRLTKTA